MITFTKTVFGDMVNYSMPDDCDMVLVCIDGKYGHKPYAIYLSHQIYRDKLEDLFEDSSIESITLIPYRNKDKIRISKQDI